MKPRLNYPLDLGDGRPPIMCRDAHQAGLLLGLWRAYQQVLERELAAALKARRAPRPTS